jgi:hypothetical protein
MKVDKIVNLNSFKKMNYNSEINLLELPKELEKISPQLLNK